MNLARCARWLAALTLFIPVRSLAQFDEMERPRAEPKHSDRESTAAREATAWTTFLKKLGPGPVYRVEVLSRDEGRFFLHQALLSPSVPQVRTMFGLGLSDAGKPVPPPDPGYSRVGEATREVTKGGMETLPLAWRTHSFRAALDPKDPRAGDRLEIVHSDIATTLALSLKPGDVTRRFFGAIWRIERLTPERLGKLEPLRQDAKAFRQRVAAIREELKSATVLGIDRDQDKRAFSQFLPQSTP